MGGEGSADLRIGWSGRRLPAAGQCGDWRSFGGPVGAKAVASLRLATRSPKRLRRGLGDAGVRDQRRDASATLGLHPRIQILPLFLMGEFGQEGKIPVDDVGFFPGAGAFAEGGDAGFEGVEGLDIEVGLVFDDPETLKAVEIEGFMAHEEFFVGFFAGRVAGEEIHRPFAVGDEFGGAVAGLVLAGAGNGLVAVTFEEANGDVGEFGESYFTRYFKALFYQVF